MPNHSTKALSLTQMQQCPYRCSYLWPQSTSWVPKMVSKVDELGAKDNDVMEQVIELGAKEGVGCT